MPEDGLNSRVILETYHYPVFGPDHPTPGFPYPGQGPNGRYPGAEGGAGLAETPDISRAGTAGSSGGGGGPDRQNGADQSINATQNTIYTEGSFHVSVPRAPTLAASASMAPETESLPKQVEREAEENVDEEDPALVFSRYPETDCLAPSDASADEEELFRTNIEYDRYLALSPKTMEEERIQWAQVRPDVYRRRREVEAEIAEMDRMEEEGRLRRVLELADDEEVSIEAEGRAKLSEAAGQTMEVVDDGLLDDVSEADYEITADITVPLESSGELTTEELLAKANQLLDESGPRLDDVKAELGEISPTKVFTAGEKQKPLSTKKKRRTSSPGATSTRLILKARRSRLGRDYKQRARQVDKKPRLVRESTPQEGHLQHVWGGCRKAQHQGLRCRCDGSSCSGDPTVSPVLSPVQENTTEPIPVPEETEVKTEVKTKVMVTTKVDEVVAGQVENSEQVCEDSFSSCSP